MKIKLNEIFHSIQGEGYWAGTPMVFIRFAGCNLSCDWCDTDHSCKMELTPSEIIEKIDALEFPRTFRVCITGGEPTMQSAGLTELVAELHELNYWVAMETNGTGLTPESVDWLTVSPKEGHPINAPLVYDEFKVVYSGQALTVYDGLERKFLQPLWAKGKESNLREVIRIVEENPEWKLSLQLHKYLGLR